MDKQYFLGKLSHINYSVAIHPGDAKSRLGSQALLVFLIDIAVIPNPYKKDFITLVKIIKDENLTSPIGMRISFHEKRNSTIAKFIKLLIDIEYQIRDEIEDKKKALINK